MVEETKQNVNLKVYPIPTENWLKVSLTVPDKGCFQLNVYSLSGQLKMPLSKMDFNEQVLVDVSSLATGTYLLEARSGNKRYLRRFIKR
ncbi:T9SS type A sorting domain-containing protein [Spirosoma soli]|uniref:T9SS type A sorting domain-containing protein n=1 Tax=Spirosoma soli TaxID=1770529 RepID=A0ABW5M400_9BACT